MPIYRLEKDPWFPDPLMIPPAKRWYNGLLFVGGDLSAQRLINAYALGIFPWTPKCREELEWYCPQKRFVIFPDEIHISHSMRNLINRRQLSLSIDRAFDDVIDNCSALRIDNSMAWLEEKMVAAYKRLHVLGHAHSVEVWQDNKLVGGLYFVHSGRCFAGESMFSLAPSASKLALIALAQFALANGINIIDCQFETAHLRSMGGRFITYEEYRRLMHPDTPDAIEGADD